MANNVRIQIAIDSRTGEARVEALGDGFNRLGRRGKKAFADIRTAGTRLKTNLTENYGLLTKVAGVFGLWQAGNLAGNVLDVADSFEQMQIKLDGLTGGHGAEVLARLNAWALEMPVNTRKAVDTFAMMQAMGLDPTIQKMQTLVDVSAMFGEDTMPRVARALGQMQALGRLSAEELNQLAEAGINARKYLKDAFGMTVEELQKSNVRIEEIINAIWSGLNADYSGQAQKAMNSWSGLKTTFISYVEEIERRFMEAGVFEALKAQLGEVNEALSRWIQNNDALLKQRVPEYVASVTDAVDGLVGVYNSLPEGVIGAAGYGILGRVLFGTWAPAKALAAFAFINTQMSHFGMGIGDMIEKRHKLNESLQGMADVITGKRDWNTGVYTAAANRVTEEFDELHDGVTTVTSDVEDFGYALNEKMARPAEMTAKDLAKLNREMDLLADLVRKSRDVWGDGYDIDYGTDELQAAIDLHNQEINNARLRLQQSIDQGARMLGAADDTYGVDYGGPADGLDDLEEAYAETSQHLISLSRRTAEAMENNFSDLYFDIMMGNFEDLSDFGQGVLRSLARATSDYMGQLTRHALFGSDAEEGLISSLASTVGGWFTASARGNVFAGPGIGAFENAIVHRPTLFPFAHGIGLMGEGGRPEAIMPLIRMPGGDLGVQAAGAGVAVHIHNYAGADIQAVQSGRTIDIVVQRAVAAVADDMAAGGPIARAAVQASVRDLRDYGSLRSTILATT